MPQHDPDIISLIAGAAFGGGAIAFLINQTFGSSNRWAWPLLLIFVGVIGLLGSRIGRSRS